MLAASYHLVVTNVPYLVRDKQEERLRDFCDRHYPTAKRDLATVFLERCLALCSEGGTASLVLPQKWLFLNSYRRLRERLLKTQIWNLLARLGTSAFATISGEVVNAILLTLTRGNTARNPGELFAPATAPDTMYSLDVSESRTATEKAMGTSSGAASQYGTGRAVSESRFHYSVEELSRFDINRSKRIRPRRDHLGRCFLFPPLFLGNRSKR